MLSFITQIDILLFHRFKVSKPLLKISEDEKKKAIGSTREKLPFERHISTIIVGIFSNQLFQNFLHPRTGERKVIREPEEVSNRIRGMDAY